MGAPIGNTNGAKENRLWGDTIRRAVAQDNGKRLRAIAEKLLDLAAEGDIQAIKEFGDRIDGKAPQSVDMVLRNKAADISDDDLAKIATNASDGATP